jgi:hypothetical protein
MKKNLLAYFFAFNLLLAPAMAFVSPAHAQNNNLNLWGNYSANEFQNETGLGQKDPRAIVASVIRVILGFLGIVAVVIILLGGFKWMTAGGNEDKVSEARKLIISGVVGLVIIMAAFGIAQFVINSLMSATNSN